MNKLTKNQDLKLMIIENYIEFYSTDDRERDEMKQNAWCYVVDDHVDEIGDEDLDMVDRVILLDEKLNGWYHALPFEALEKIHGIVLFKKLEEDALEEYLDSLYNDWTDMTMVEKARWYDNLHKKYLQFTDQVIVN